MCCVIADKHVDLERDEKIVDLAAKSFHADAGKVKTSLALAKELFHTSSSTTLSDLRSGSGWKKLDVAVLYRQSEVFPEFKLQFLEKRLQDPIFNLIDKESTRAEIRNFLSELFMTNTKSTKLFSQMDKETHSC